MNSKTTCLFSVLLVVVVVHSAVIVDPNATGLGPVQTFLGAAAGGVHGSDGVDDVFSDEIHGVNNFLEDIFDGDSHESGNPVVGVNVHSAEHEDSNGDVSDDHSRDRNNHDERDESGEHDNHSKDNDNHSNDDDNHSKDDDNHSKDNDRHSKDDDNHSKDDDNHSKDNDNHSKDSDNHSKDNDNHSKDNDNHSKDNDNHSKDNDNHSRENDNHSKDNDNHSKDKDNKSNDSDSDKKSKDSDDKTRDNDRSDDRDNNRRSRQRRVRKGDSDEDSDNKDSSDEKLFRNLFRARGYLEAFESWREAARAAQTGTCPLYPVKVESDTITITTLNGCRIIIQLKGIAVDHVKTVQDSSARTLRAVSVSYTSDD